MKINIQNFTITTKSETCVSKNGKPLSEYSSYQEAFDSAGFQKSNNGIELVPYNCSKCGKYHLKPKEFFCEKKTNTCGCKDHNGKTKDLYATQFDAEKMANIRKAAGIELFVYECPQRLGFHLTSQRG